MSNESQKAKIAMLEHEILEYRCIIDKLQDEILTIKKNADINFLNSELYRQMIKRIDTLEFENKNLKSKGSINTKKNERGAGRKQRLSKQEQETIRMYRIQGMKMKELSEMFSCSIGLISKILSEDIVEKRKLNDRKSKVDK